MGSINASLLAHKVSENIRNGKKVSVSAIMREIGYSYTTSLKPALATRTASYQKVMKPFAEQLKAEIDRITLELSTRDLTKEKYEVLTIALDKLNKNFQLATGGNTDNTRMTIEISEAIAKKYVTPPSTN